MRFSDKFSGFLLVIFSFVVFFSFPVVQTAYAATCASNATGDWNATGTWTSCGGGVPQSGDSVTIGAHTVTIPSGVTINTVANITVGDGGTLTQSGTGQNTISGTLTINSGGKLTHTDNSTTQSNVINLSVGGLDLQSGGSINVDGLGFDGGYYEDTLVAGNNWGRGYGIGYGSAVYGKGGGGGGYGGDGGDGRDSGAIAGAGGVTNGDEEFPDELGSGGAGAYYAMGGSGGGSIKITITGGGTATIAGDITAAGGAGGENGGNNKAGGGSGGAIWIDFTAGGAFAGGGTIAANGGDAGDNGLGKEGGTGGGGRAAVTGYSSNTYSGSYSLIAGDDPNCCETGLSYGAIGTQVNGLMNTNVEPATLVQSVSETATVTFTTTQAIPSDGTIEVIFGANFDVSSGSSATCSTMDGSFATSISSQKVIITRSGGSSEAAGAQTCTIGSVVNPASIGSAGTYTIQTTNSSSVILDIEDAVAADTILSANANPTATAPGSISQATDASGKVTFTSDIADDDDDTSTALVEYSDDGGTTWYYAGVGSVSGTEGSPGYTNDAGFSTDQISSVTTTGTNTLTIVWDSQNSSTNQNSGIDDTDQSDIQLRITPNDGTVDGTTQTSASFAVDNLNPSGLAGFSVGAHTTATIPLIWTAPTEANFNHYEIWFGTSQGDVQNRTGTATEWNENDDTDLATRTTADTTITGLLPNVQYYFKIWAIDDFGNLETISDINAYTTANTPGAPTVAAATTTSLTVTVDVNSNPSPTEFAIKAGSSYVQADGTLGASEVWQTYTNWGGANGQSVSGLSTNTQYALSVKARNGDSDETSLSSETSAYTLAAEVASLTSADATTTSLYQVTLTWTDAGESGMKIEQDTGCDGSFDATVLYDVAGTNATSPYTVTSLSSNTCYTFKASSYNGDETLNSTNVATALDITTPLAAPVSLSTGSVTSTTFTLGWDAVTGADSYFIYNSSDDSVVGSSTGTSYPYTGASGSTSYEFYIRTFNSNGHSVASSLIGLTTQAGATSNNGSSSSGGGGGSSGGSASYVKIMLIQAEDEKTDAVEEVVLTEEIVTETADENGHEDETIPVPVESEAVEEVAVVEEILEDETVSVPIESEAVEEVAVVEEILEPTRISQKELVVAVKEAEVRAETVRKEAESEKAAREDAKILAIEIDEMGVFVQDNANLQARFIDELLLLKRATRSFSETVAGVSNDNLIPQEYVEIAVATNQNTIKRYGLSRSIEIANRTEDAQRIQSILGIDIDKLSVEERREAERVVQKKIEESVKAELTDRLIRITEGDETETFPERLYIGNDEYVEIEDEAELRKVVSDLAKRVIEEGLDLGRDGVDDRIQIALDIPLIVKSTDGDSTLRLADKIAFDLDVSEDAPTPDKPQVVVQSSLVKSLGLGGVSGPLKTGSSPMIRLYGGRSGGKAKVTLVDTTDITKKIYVGEVEMDEESKGTVVAEGINPGEYYVMVVSDAGISELATIVVEDQKNVPAKPVVRFVGDEQIDEVIETLPDFAKDLLKKILRSMINRKPVLRGVAKPGEMVFVTWKSFTLSSIVMADAGQGGFEIEIPPEAEFGEHEVIVYSYDLGKNMVSDVSTMLFSWNQ